MSDVRDNESFKHNTKGLQILYSYSLDSISNFQEKEGHAKVYLDWISPVKTISMAIYNYIKSVLFVSMYVGICKYVLCKMKNFRNKIDGKHI